jgi:SPP1 gp7 family putative phage head morphogenesis protein
MTLYSEEIEQRRVALHRLASKRALESYLRRGWVPEIWRTLADASRTEEKFARHLIALYGEIPAFAKKTAMRLLRETRESHSTPQYVWRTRGDNKIRPTHAAKDGKIFSWDAPLPAYHPGEQKNCRCWAEPYVQGRTEFAHHEFISDLYSSVTPWDDTDFVWHYYFGGGRFRTLDQIGHLRQIAEYYAYHHGAFRRLSDQIADEARKKVSGPFTHDFWNTYDFKPIAFSYGSATVKGLFAGTVEERGSMLFIQGRSSFLFFDRFADPTGHGIEPGGTPYEITGNWITSFTAQVFKDASKSQYYDRSK